MVADDLYGLPLERFVPARDALAHALRVDGRREEAADVGGLRKPSVAAWAVNQLVRTQGKGLRVLFDAGDALRKAQADLVAGRGDGGALRTAAERERNAVEALVSTARGLLSTEGHELSAAIIDRVGDTVHAAALDDEARAKVRDGRLERELRHAGLGVGIAAVGAAPAPPAARRSAPPAARRTAPTKQKRAVARRVERERADARADARAAEAQARRLADRAARALEVAEERRERAAQALHGADEALASARERAQAAADAHRRAQEDLSGT